MVMVVTLEEGVLLSYWYISSNDLVLSPLSVVAIELTDGLLTLTDLQVNIGYNIEYCYE